MKIIQQVDIENRKNLRLACKRFEHAYETISPEDQLIDLIIALEILFLKGEEALSHKGTVIGIGCSMLLGRNNEEREQIRKVLKKAYSIRNDIVHGSEFKVPIIADKEYILTEFINKVENYLRESLNKLLT